MHNRIRRPRRNRKSAAIRAIVEETRLSVNDFIFPLFLIEGSDKKEEIPSMPGIYRYSLDVLLDEIQECMHLGIKGFVCFLARRQTKKINMQRRDIVKMDCIFKRCEKSNLSFRRLL